MSSWGGLGWPASGWWKQWVVEARGFRAACWAPQRYRHGATWAALRKGRAKCSLGLGRRTGAPWTANSCRLTGPYQRVRACPQSCWCTVSCLTLEYQFLGDATTAVRHALSASQPGAWHAVGSPSLIVSTAGISSTGFEPSEGQPATGPFGGWSLGGGQNAGCPDKAIRSAPVPPATRVAAKSTYCGTGAGLRHGKLRTAASWPDFSNCMPSESIRKRARPRRRSQNPPGPATPCCCRRARPAGRHTGGSGVPCLKGRLVCFEKGRWGKPRQHRDRGGVRAALKAEDAPAAVPVPKRGNANGTA